jgi:single-strand DNA-binding protein
MEGWAKVSILGTLGRDAEVQALPSGKLKTKMRVAVSHRWKDAQGIRQEQTVWLDAVDWFQRPDWLRQKLSKGATVAIQGELRDDSYKNKDGVNVSRIRVNVDSIEVFARQEFVGERRTPDGSGTVQRGTEDMGEFSF